MSNYLHRVGFVLALAVLLSISGCQSEINELGVGEDEPRDEEIKLGKGSTFSDVFANEERVFTFDGEASVEITVTVTPSVGNPDLTVIKKTVTTHRGSGEKTTTETTINRSQKTEGPDVVSFVGEEPSPSNETYLYARSYKALVEGISTSSFAISVKTEPFARVYVKTFSPGITSGYGFVDTEIHAYRGIENAGNFVIASSNDDYASNLYSQLSLNITPKDELFVEVLGKGLSVDGIVAGVYGITITTEKANLEIPSTLPVGPAPATNENDDPANGIEIANNSKTFHTFSAMTDEEDTVDWFRFALPGD